METILVIFIVICLILFYVVRPVSKEELKRFEDNDNWSNMGF